MVSGISLTSSMRSNLLSLQQITELQSISQNRLATGLKVNSAIDNPAAYYTASSLSNRARDLSSLLDGMGQAIQTVKAAMEGVESATAYLEQMQAVTAQATSNLTLKGQEEAPYVPIEFKDLYNGKANTKILIDEVGADALAATACNQFYVGSKTDANFGQGNWYLPALGELMDVYGYDVDAITSATGTSGAVGDNKTTINNALSTLASKGAEAATLTNGYYWSSSENDSDSSWILGMDRGYRKASNESIDTYVRSFQLLENCFNPLTLSDGSQVSPQIGNVVYTDLSYGAADDYDGSRTAAGIVTWVSEDGKSAKIMSLKDLTFSSNNTVGNFNPDNPYGGSVKYTYHTTSAKYTQDTSIKNYNSSNVVAALQEGRTVQTQAAVTPTVKGTEIELSGEYANQYNTILGQYNMLIKDSNYKGINLLLGNALKVDFNEDKSSKLEIEGKDLRSETLGIKEADWKTVEELQSSVEDLSRAVATLRQTSNELGNNYSVILSRQEFTESMINILTEGADKLTLADMNEESANMLALETRQMLAINSLSLASQSSQSVLRLF